MQLSPRSVGLGQSPLAAFGNDVAATAELGPAPTTNVSQPGRAWQNVTA